MGSRFSAKMFFSPQNTQFYFLAVTGIYVNEPTTCIFYILKQRKQINRIFAWYKRQILSQFSSERLKNSERATGAAQMYSRLSASPGASRFHPVGASRAVVLPLRRCSGRSFHNKAAAAYNSPWACARGNAKTLRIYSAKSIFLLFMCVDCWLPSWRAKTEIAAAGKFAESVQFV